MHFDLVIIGGGLAGLSLACALRESSLRIALVEAKPPSPISGWDSRIYAISPSSAAFLQNIGVWEHLDTARILPIEAMQVYGDANAQLNFSAYEAGVTELAFIVESSLMSLELWEHVKRQSNVQLYCPNTPHSVRIEAHAAYLQLEDGCGPISSKLIVAADGRQSSIRRQLGLESTCTDYQEKAIVANFLCSKAHRNTAHQWFRGNSVLAWLPLPDNLMSMVWSLPNIQAEELLAQSPENFARQVAHAGNDQLGELSLLTAPTAFPLQLLHVPQIVSPRLALLGDAAHGLHPLSGHGINLGYQDAYILAKTLTAPNIPHADIGSLKLLERYQRARKEEVLCIQKTTDTLHRLFKSQLPGIQHLRNWGMTLLNAQSTLKNKLVRYALGSL